MTRSRAKAAAKKPDLKITTAAAQARRKVHLDEEHPKRQPDTTKTNKPAATSTAAGQGDDDDTAARGRPRKQAAVSNAGNENASARSAIPTSSSAKAETTSARATSPRAKKVAFSATKNEAEADTKPAPSKNTHDSATVVRQSRKETETKGKGLDAKPMRKPIGGARRTKVLSANATEAKVETRKVEIDKRTTTAAPACPIGDSITVCSELPERQRKLSQQQVPQEATHEATHEALQKSPVRVKVDNVPKHGQILDSSSQAQVALEETASPPRMATMIAAQSLSLIHI